MAFQMVFYFDCIVERVCHFIPPFAVYTHFPTRLLFYHVHIRAAAKQLDCLLLCFDKT